MVSERRDGNNKELVRCFVVGTNLQEERDLGGGVCISVNPEFKRTKSFEALMRG